MSEKESPCREMSFHDLCANAKTYLPRIRDEGLIVIAEFRDGAKQPITVRVSLAAGGCKETVKKKTEPEWDEDLSEMNQKKKAESGG